MAELKVIYEDNHIIAVNKGVSDLVQGDITGDETLPDKIKAYLKVKYQKPGEVFLGVVHRLDRPVSGVVIYARTSKALTRLNKMFVDKTIKKTYWALVQDLPPQESGKLVDWLLKNPKNNKSSVYNSEKNGAKKAILNYQHILSLNKYHLLEVDLETGRHHQIRCQLGKMGCIIKGDLKYGAKRSNPDGGISLHARCIEFVHPVSGDSIKIVAEPPKDNLWKDVLAAI